MDAETVFKGLVRLVTKSRLVVHGFHTALKLVQGVAAATAGIVAALIVLVLMAKKQQRAARNSGAVPSPLLLKVFQGNTTELVSPQATLSPQSAALAPTTPEHFEQQVATVTSTKYVSPLKGTFLPSYRFSAKIGGLHASDVGPREVRSLRHMLTRRAEASERAPSPDFRH